MTSSLTREIKGEGTSWRGQPEQNHQHNGAVGLSQEKAGPWLEERMVRDD